MTAKNKADIQSEIDTLLADNTTGDISELDVRTVLETAKDSYINALETANQTLTSKLNGATIAAETTRSGFMTYGDLATQTTPISVTGGAAYAAIPNDGLGSLSSGVGKVGGVGQLWNAATGLFTFNDGMNVLDHCIIRLALEFTTSAANQEIVVRFHGGIGATDFYVPWARFFYKSSGAQEVVVMPSIIYLQTTNAQANGARFEIKSANNLTYKVQDFTIVHYLRG